MSQLPKCRGKTKSGRRCKRFVSEDVSFCWQHAEKKNQSDEKPEKVKAKARKIPAPKAKNPDKNSKSRKTKLPHHAPNVCVPFFTRCIVEGCPQASRVGRELCGKHECHEKNCKELAVSGKVWCPSHICRYPECSYRGPACGVHKCHAENCRNLKFSTRFCVQHACSVNNCMCQCEDGGGKKGYCIVHKKQYALEKPDECPVCLEEFKKDEEPWPCGHYIHRSCITQSLKAECPLCRTVLRLTREEERAIHARSHQAREERNQEMLNGLQNQEVMNQMLIRFGPAYPQILSFLMNFQADNQLQFVV